MPMGIMDPKSGRTVLDTDPGYDRVRITVLQAEVDDLRQAVIDLQNRMSRVDEEPPQWPSDTYPARNTDQYDG